MLFPILVVSGLVLSCARLLTSIPPCGLFSSREEGVFSNVDLVFAFLGFCSFASSRSFPVQRDSFGASWVFSACFLLSPPLVPLSLQCPAGGLPSMFCMELCLVAFSLLIPYWGLRASFDFSTRKRNKKEGRLGRRRCRGGGFC